MTAQTICAENSARVPFNSWFPCPWVWIAGPCHWPVKSRVRCLGSFDGVLECSFVDLIVDLLEQDSVVQVTDVAAVFDTVDEVGT